VICSVPESEGNHGALCILVVGWRVLCLRIRLCMLIFSCSSYGGPILSACPRTHCGDTFLCFMADRRVLAAVIASTLGLD
jgi:hypothetical protein